MEFEVEIAEALEPLFANKKARYRVAYGGRGSSKSWAFAQVLLVRAMEKKRKILCARELQNSIKDSVIALLREQIDKLGLPGFEVTETSIKHENGSEFIFKGLRSNAQEIKSTEGIDICWVEEAQAVSADSWGLLIPTIRKDGSEIWVSFNPLNKEDAASQMFIERQPDNALVIHINWDDNPWFPEVLRIEKDYLKRIDFETYMNVWEGAYRNPNKGGRLVPNWSFGNVDHVDYDPEKKLYLTCDFNVDPMCWALAHRPRINGQYHYRFFDEITRENTTITSQSEDFVRRYGKHKAGIVITGDASGNSRSDMAARENQTRYAQMTQVFSDLGMREEQFTLDTSTKNPFKTERYNTFNQAVSNHFGVKRVFVDPRCKQIIRACEGLHYIPGSDQPEEPTPQEIKKKPDLKWKRLDMYDAISYLVSKYEPKLEVVTEHRVVSKAIPFKPGR